MSVKFLYPFDATVGRFLLPDDPAEYARTAWDAPAAELDLATACEMAPRDLEVWQALHEKCREADLAQFPQPALAALCRALAAPKPRKGAGATARRNARLRALAAVLRAQYGLPLTSGVVPLLCDLVPMDQQAMVNLLYNKN